LLFQDLAGSFGDVMSYLRLFALGIASVKVAEAFNQMAGGLGVLIMGLFESVPWLVWLGFVLAAAGMSIVIAFGHVLNIVLCAMSVLVHGVRLNALEFSMHIGQEWAGFQYQPFADGSAAGVETTAA
jgi:V/A-type H+-transporting ATPase subunit I